MSGQGKAGMECGIKWVLAMKVGELVLPAQFPLGAGAQVKVLAYVRFQIVFDQVQ